MRTPKFILNTGLNYEQYTKGSSNNILEVANLILTKSSLELSYYSFIYHYDLKYFYILYYNTL